MLCTTPTTAMYTGNWTEIDVTEVRQTKQPAHHILNGVSVHFLETVAEVDLKRKRLGLPHQTPHITLHVANKTKKCEPWPRTLGFESIAI